MGNTFSCLFPKKKCDSTRRAGRKKPCESKCNYNDKPILRRVKRDEYIWKIEDLEVSEVRPTSAHHDLSSSHEGDTDNAVGPNSSTDITQHDSVDSGFADISSSYQDLPKTESRLFKYSTTQDGYCRDYRSKCTKDHDSVPMSLRQANEDYSKRMNKQRQMARTLLKLHNSPSPVQRDQNVTKANTEKTSIYASQGDITKNTEEQTSCCESHQNHGDDRKPAEEDGDREECHEYDAVVKQESLRMVNKVPVATDINDKVLEGTQREMRDGRGISISHAESKTAFLERHESNNPIQDMNQDQKPISSFCKLQKSPSPHRSLPNVGKTEVLPVIENEDDISDESLRRLRDAFFQEFVPEDRKESTVPSFMNVEKEEMLPVFEKEADITDDNLRHLRDAFYQEFLIEEEDGDFIASDSSRSGNTFLKQKETATLEYVSTSKEEDSEYETNGTDIDSNGLGLRRLANENDLSYDSQCQCASEETEEIKDLIYENEFDINNAKEQTRYKKSELETIFEDKSEEEKEELEDFCMNLMERCIDSIKFDVTRDIISGDTFRKITSHEKMADIRQDEEFNVESVKNRIHPQCIINERDIIKLDREIVHSPIREIHETPPTKQMDDKVITDLKCADREVKYYTSWVIGTEHSFNEENKNVRDNYVTKDLDINDQGHHCDITDNTLNEGLSDDAKSHNTKGNPGKDIDKNDNIIRKELENLWVNEVADNKRSVTDEITKDMDKSKDQTIINETQEEQTIKYNKTAEANVPQHTSIQDSHNAPKDTYTTTMKENQETLIVRNDKDKQAHNEKDNKLKLVSGRMSKDQSTTKLRNDKSKEQIKTDSRRLLGPATKTNKPTRAKKVNDTLKDTSCQKRHIRPNETGIELKSAFSRVANCFEDTKPFEKFKTKDTSNTERNRSGTRTREHLQQEIPKVVPDISKSKSIDKSKRVSDSHIAKSTAGKRRLSSTRTSGGKRPRGTDKAQHVTKPLVVEKTGITEEVRVEDEQYEISKQRGPDRGIVWPQKMEDLYSAEDRTYYVDQFQRTEMFRQRLKRKQQNNNAWSRALSQFQTWVIE